MPEPVFISRLKRILWFVAIAAFCTLTVCTAQDWQHAQPSSDPYEAR